MKVSSLPPLRRSKSRQPAVASSATQFRQERLKNLKEQWKLWMGFGALAIGAFAFILWFGTVGVLIGGLMLGFITAISLVGWMIGFNVRAVSYLWGSWGEDDTSAELARLGRDWYVRHGIPNPPYGNFDHVAVGPPGVFVIDTKRLNGRRIALDLGGLSSDNIRYRDTTFTGQAYGLRKALFAHARNVPRVDAVVAIWGDFAMEPQEKEHLVYLNATDLVAWLEGRDPILDATRRAALVAAVAAL